MENEFLIIPMLLANSKEMAGFDVTLLKEERVKLIVQVMQNIQSTTGMTPNIEILGQAIMELNPGLHEWMMREMEQDEKIPDMSLTFWQLRERYNDGVLLRVNEVIHHGIQERRQTREIVSDVLAMLNHIRGQNRSTDMRSAVLNTMDVLHQVYQGKKQATWRTSKPEVDELLMYGPRQIVLVAAQQKIGKSRFVIETALDLLTLNPGLRINWYNFEQEESELVHGIIAYHTMIPTSVINGKERLPTSEEQAMIAQAGQMLMDQPIRFVNEKMHTGPLMQDIARHSGPDAITIIDNFGLVRPDDGREGNAHDDHLMGELVDVRDRTGSLIYLLHHLNKQSGYRFNKENLYRPNLGDSRGSNRIMDYANSAILLHRIERYPDLRDILSDDQWEKAQGKMELAMPFNRDGIHPSGELLLDHELGVCRTNVHSRGNVDFPNKGQQLAIDLS